MKYGIRSWRFWLGTTHSEHDVSYLYDDKEWAIKLAMLYGFTYVVAPLVLVLLGEWRTAGVVLLAGLLVDRLFAFLLNNSMFFHVVLIWTRFRGTPVDVPEGLSEEALRRLAHGNFGFHVLAMATPDVSDPMLPFPSRRHRRVWFLRRNNAVKFRLWLPTREDHQ